MWHRDRRGHSEQVAWHEGFPGLGYGIGFASGVRGKVAACRIEGWERATAELG